MYIHELKKQIEKFKAKGINKANSTSNTKNKIAIKKNFNEKGIRLSKIGSNPHSKGDIFSWSYLIFLETIAEINKTKDETKVDNINTKNKIKII